MLFYFGYLGISNASAFIRNECPYTLLCVFPWLHVSLCSIACILMLYFMCPYSRLHVSFYSIACVLILDCMCPYTWLHVSLCWLHVSLCLITCVLILDRMCPYTRSHACLFSIACVLMLDRMCAYSRLHASLCLISCVLILHTCVLRNVQVKKSTKSTWRTMQMCTSSLTAFMTPKWVRWSTPTLKIPRVRSKTRMSRNP